jgi:hypothetical protein
MAASNFRSRSRRGQRGNTARERTQLVHRLAEIAEITDEKAWWFAAPSGRETCHGFVSLGATVTR